MKTVNGDQVSYSSQILGQKIVKGFWVTTGSTINTGPVT